MLTGGPTTSAPGQAQDEILDIQAEVVAGNSIKVTMSPWGPYRDRYWAPFISGTYTGTNVKSHDLEDIVLSAQLPYSATSGGVYFEDAGQWASFNPDYVPDDEAHRQEALSASEIQISWTGTYSVTLPTGDDQVSLNLVTGAKRGRNVGHVPNRRTRGRLYYSISTPSGSTHIVRFWANGRVVAEGQIDGDGTVVLSEANGSGLSANLDLTYSSDIAPTVAYFDLRWSSAFQVHYSTSAMTYPRTPQAVISDTGVDSYIYLSPSIGPGTYNVAVVAIDDEGVVETAGIPSVGGLSIYAGPVPASNFSVSTVVAMGNSTPTVHWTIGETGCTFKVYSGNPDEPINFGRATTPAIVTTALNATSATLAPIAVSALATTDYTSDFATLTTSFDAGVDDVLSAYDAGESGFVDAFQAALDDLLDAISTFETVLDSDLSAYSDYLQASGQRIISASFSFGGVGLTSDDWHDAMQFAIGQFLVDAGQTLNGDGGRYHFSDGTLPAGGTPPSSTRDSLKRVASPLVRNKEIRVVVRAVKSGVEDQTNQEVVVEFDSTGAIVPPRPNVANVEDISIEGLDATVTANVLEDDTSAVADAIVLYVSPVITPITETTTPTDSQDLPDPIANYHAVSLTYTASGAGWYQFGVRASSGGVLSPFGEMDITTMFIADDSPSPVTDLVAKIVSAKDNI